MKKTLAFLLAVVLLASMVACRGDNGQATPGTTTASTTTETTTEPEQTPTTPELIGLEKNTYPILSNSDKIKILGRGMEADGGITADWPAAGIEFKAYCENTVSVTASCRGPMISFSVYVDNVLQPNAALFFASNPTTVIASNLTAGEHSFRLVRRNMAESGNTPALISLTGIEVYGELTEKPADKQYLIEFVGDSITCGYGIGDLNPADGSNTYATKTAKQLDADYSVIAVSGIGVYKGTSRHASTVVNMATTYDLNNWYRNPQAAYTPSRQADVVVVNLNTNDNSQVASLTGEDLEAAESGYKEAARLLLQKIRTAHGDDVKIVWVMGMMSNSTVPEKVRADEWLQQIFVELGGESAGYYTLSLIRNTSADAGHPNASNHSINATRLAMFIEETVFS